MKITIIGTGAFGLAIGSLWHQYAKCNLIFYTPFLEEQKEIIENHTNQKVLPGIKLKEELRVTTDLKESLFNAELIVLAIPCEAVRMVLEKIKQEKNEKFHYLFVSKGLEQSSAKCMSEIYDELQMNGTFSYLAGPTFAKEMLQNIPTGMTLATNDQTAYEIIKNLFSNTKIEIEASKDIIGVQYASVLKNIFAILMGAISRKYKTDSTKAYLLTKTFQQLQNLLIKLGGEKETAQTFSGIGDLLLTCNSINSRNYYYGKLLEEDKQKAEDFLLKNTVEGYYAIQSLLAVCQKKKIDAPIVNFIKNYINDIESLENIFNIIS